MADDGKRFKVYLPSRPCSRPSTPASTFQPSRERGLHHILRLAVLHKKTRSAVRTNTEQQVGTFDQLRLSIRPALFLRYVPLPSAPRPFRSTSRCKLLLHTQRRAILISTLIGPQLVRCYCYGCRYVGTKGFTYERILISF